MRPRMDACAAILNGYTQGIFNAAGGSFVLSGRQHHGLRDLALNELRDPVRFWDKINRWPPARQIPPGVKAILTHALPGPVSDCRILHRKRPGWGACAGPAAIFTLVAQWCGGYIAREAKRVVPSAWQWMGKKQNGKRFFMEAAITRAVRVPDPTVSTQKQWLVRRLAPDCSRIELSQLPAKRDGIKLVRAMGFETANIHLGTKNAAKKSSRRICGNVPRDGSAQSRQSHGAGLQ